MFNRKHCKSYGKTAFKSVYWLCVLVSVILFVCAQGIEASYSVPAVKGIVSGELLNGVNNIFEEGSVRVDFPGTLIEIFVLNIFSVGCYGFFVKLYCEECPSLSELIKGFNGSVYGRNLVTMFLRDLFTVLWTLLLIIPGIVKGYEYSMIPYILAEDPTLDRRAAFARSKELTQGCKWDLFVFDISFIGWWLLSALTLGVLSILYVNPYYQAAKAKVYHELKANRTTTY